MDVTNLKYRLFNRVLTLRLYEQAGRDLFFFTMHDDETTSVRTGRRMIRRHGGTLLELTHEGTRNVEFRYDEWTFRFDPNRIFSDAGISRTLFEQSDTDDIPEEITNGTGTFAAFLKDRFQLRQKSGIHTLHNTTDDLTVESYLEGAEFEHNASSVHIQPGRRVTDFFLVTERTTYETLRERNWNVVLQDEKNVEEDGSLSVWAGNSGIPYINVEARLGHINSQKTMVRDLYRVSDR